MALYMSISILVSSFARGDLVELKLVPTRVAGHDRGIEPDHALIRTNAHLADPVDVNVRAPADLFAPDADDARDLGFTDARGGAHHLGRGLGRAWVDVPVQGLRHVFARPELGYMRVIIKTVRRAARRT